MHMRCSEPLFDHIVLVLLHLPDFFAAIRPLLFSFSFFFFFYSLSLIPDHTHFGAGTLFIFLLQYRMYK